MDPIFWALLVVPPVLAGAIAWRPMKHWIKKCKRRKGGVYLVRMDHHANRARRINGYVGETTSFYLRQRQHLGSSRFDPATGLPVRPARGQVGLALVRIPAQPWSDLNPVWRKVIKLPWWLCWKWVLRPLETLVMVFTWPVYNDAKNHWNPRRRTKRQAMQDRAFRDAGGYRYKARVWVSHAVRGVVAVAGAVLVGLGTYGWMVGPPW